MSMADIAELKTLAEAAKTIKVVHALAESLGDDNGYVQGFRAGTSDCWEFMQTLQDTTPDLLCNIFGTRSLIDILMRYSIEEVLSVITTYAKSAYIVSRDEVELDDGTCCMILNVMGEEVGYRCLTSSGQVRIVPTSAVVRKTSKYFPQLEEILSALKEDSEG